MARGLKTSKQQLGLAFVLFDLRDRASYSSAVMNWALGLEWHLWHRRYDPHSAIASRDARGIPGGIIRDKSSLVLPDDVGRHGWIRADWMPWEGSLIS